MEDNYLGPHSSDCACKGNVYSYNPPHLDDADNTLRLNEKGVATRCEDLSGPDAYAIRQHFAPGVGSNLLNGPDGAVSLQQNGSLRLPVMNFNDWPRVENGLLAFRDHEQYDAYSQYLEDMSNSLGLGRGNLSKQEFFNNVESQIGFSSLRRVTDEAFDRLAEKGWGMYETIPDRHFIPDVLLKSVLNPQGEVKIGNKITRIINKSVAVTVSASNHQLIALMRQLPYHITRRAVKRIQAKYPVDFYVDDWSIQDSDFEQGNVFTDTASEFNWNNTGIGDTLYSGGDTPDTDAPAPAPTDSPMDSGSSWGGGITLTRPYAIAASFSIKVVNQCEHQRRIKTEGLYLTQGPLLLGGAWTLVRSKFIIEWGDGAFTTVFSDSSGYVTDEVHDYLTPGFKSVVVRGWKVNASGAVVGPMVGPVSKTATIGCFVGQSRDSNWREHVVPGFRKIRGKHWVEQWVTWGGVGSKKARTGAETEALQWNHKTFGGWKFRHADVDKNPKSKKDLAVVTIYWIQKYYENTCERYLGYPNPAEPFKGWGIAHNWKGDTWHTHHGSHFGWFEMKSRHELHLNNGSFIILEFATNVCDL